MPTAPLHAIRAHTPSSGKTFVVDVTSAPGLVWRVADEAARSGSLLSVNKLGSIALPPRFRIDPDQSGYHVARMRHAPFISFIALCAASSTALAVDLPISGIYGMDADDCKAAKQGNEGGYVAFEKSSTGEGGQGGCDITGVKKTGPNAYSLTGICQPLEGPRKRRNLKLVVKSDGMIEYDGADYKRCPK